MKNQEKLTTLEYVNLLIYISYTDVEFQYIYEYVNILSDN